MASEPPPDNDIDTLFARFPCLGGFYGGGILSALDSIRAIFAVRFFA
jgi:hypothetical protein